LSVEPGSALLQDVRPVLLNRLAGLFAHDAVTGEKAMKRRVRHQADASQSDAKLIKRDALPIFPERQDLLGVPQSDESACPRGVVGCKASSCAMLRLPPNFPSNAQRQLVPPPNGSSSLHQPQPAAASASPSGEADPSILAFFTSQHDDQKIKPMGISS